MAKIELKDVIELAFAVNEGDPMDWSAFKEGKEQAMTMIATSVLNQFNKEEFTSEDLLIMISTITKLLTENMILQTQILRLQQQNEV